MCALRVRSRSATEPPALLPRRRELDEAYRILVMVYHLLKEGSSYHELGASYFATRNEQRVKQRLVERLTGLGYKVTLEPAASLGPAETLEALLQLGLTRREAEVSLAVLRGRTTVESAAELVVSPHTVHDHLRNMFEKLGVSSRQQLATRLLSGA